jgi:amylosucrase
MDGVPMLYMGDEIALLNDTSFLDDPERRAELRWLHRPEMDWARANGVQQTDACAQLMLRHIQKLNAALASLPDWSEAAPATPLPTSDPALLGFERALSGGRFVCLANLSDEVIEAPRAWVGEDLLSGQTVRALEPCKVVWIRHVEGRRK